MTEETTLRRYERAQLFFEAKDYIVAAELLESVVADVPSDLAPRELLSHAYYHSAQLKRAETQLRWIAERRRPWRRHIDRRLSPGATPQELLL